MDSRNNRLHSFVQGLGLFIVLLCFVLIVNTPVISFNMLYPEQPILYLVNQKITGFAGLLKIYLHPKMLNLLIPFFRPSGHFLIYQIVTPFLGWHNLKGLIIVNLIFLTLTGYVLIMLYRRLFPGFRTGGYVAFSIYLMHPTLSLSRFTAMHFEFAHTLFLLLSLYCFSLFCQSRKFILLASTLLFYFIAVTFKETAIMLGPVLIVYFLLSIYSERSFKQFISILKNENSIRELLLLLCIACIILGFYVTSQWPSFYHPLRGEFKLVQLLGPINIFIKNLFAIPVDIFPHGFVTGADMPWRNIVFPFATQLIIWCLTALMLVTSFIISINKSDRLVQYRNTFSFLYMASIIFLIMPMLWSMGLPWHLSLTLLCVSLMMGFSVEYFLRYFFANLKWVYICSLAIALFIGYFALPMNKANIKKYKLNQPNIYLGLLLNRNAILHPPDIKNKLNNDSVIVVEDSFIHSAHMLGNSFYPFYLLGNFNYSRFEKDMSFYFWKWHPVYNGTLFRWAYLIPSIKEEIYPFRIEQMQIVPNEIIYNWLQHYNNIFCLGYDQKAMWHDRSAVFKQRLLDEKKNRKLVVKPYTLIPATIINGLELYKKEIPYPDSQLCQYLCDQDEKCKGFTFINKNMLGKRTMQCQFYGMIIPKSEKSRSFCTTFIKG